MVRGKKLDVAGLEFYGLLRGQFALRSVMDTLESSLNCQHSLASSPRMPEMPC